MRHLTSCARGLAALLVALSWPTAAAAQVYSWRDAAGNLVLSDRRTASLAAVASASYPVGASTTVRSTRNAPRARSSRFDDIIVRHAATHGIRPDLIRAVIQTESAFDPWARSPKGAMGLMQLMPGTATELGVIDAYDPEENVRAGVAYLKSLLTRYRGNEELALAAYNAGPGAVDRFGRQVPPYRETRDYLDRVRGATSLASVSRERIYKTVQVIDGREVPRYTNVRPGPNASEIVAARRR